MILLMSLLVALYIYAQAGVWVGLKWAEWSPQWHRCTNDCDHVFGALGIGIAWPITAPWVLLKHRRWRVKQRAIELERLLNEAGV